LSLFSGFSVEPHLRFREALNGNGHIPETRGRLLDRRRLTLGLSDSAVVTFAAQSTLERLKLT